MTTSETPTVLWEKEASEKNISAAEDFLRLTFPPEDVAAAGRKWKEHRTRIERFKAKDLLRASGLKLLPVTDAEVAGKLAKIHRGEPLHPVLLVRDKKSVTIADGFHRICACYHIGDDTDVACVLVHV